MLTKNQILDNYQKGLSVEGALRTQYLRHATHFLEYTEGSGELTFDRQTVDAFLKHLAATHHYSPGTVAFIFRIVRTMFARSDIDWPYRHGEAPTVRENEVNAPALHPDVISKMIEAVKASGDPDEKAFLAVSSTYGTRKEEMARITAADVNLQDHTIHVSTVKHGRDRLHLLPEELVPIFSQYDFAQGTTGQRLFFLWYRLEHRVGMKHVEGVNWHSIRRTLDTLLLARGVPAADVMSFLRWKQRTSSNMPYRYSAQTFVGFNGKTTNVIGEALRVDQFIFGTDENGERRHPFIDYWR